MTQKFKAKAEFRTIENETGKKIIEGYFAKFNEETQLWIGFYEKIQEGAFTNSLKNEKNIVCLFNHDSNMVLGNIKNTTLTLKQDEIGLYGSVQINENDTEALNIYERVKRGDITGCSFGFFILDSIEETKEDARYTTILDVDLFEVSICTFPAYEGTIVEARKKEYKEKQINNFLKRKEKLKTKLERI